MSGIDPGGDVSEVGGRGWQASEHAGSAGQAPREGSPYPSRVPGTAGWRACGSLGSMRGRRKRGHIGNSGLKRVANGPEGWPSSLA